MFYSSFTFYYLLFIVYSLFTLHHLICLIKVELQSKETLETQTDPKPVETGYKLSEQDSHMICSCYQ